MFSPEHYNFGFPLFVTSFHMVVQFTLSAIVIGLFPSLRPNARPQAKEYACATPLELLCTDRFGARTG
jgi:solute carrier family 35 protein C2